MIKIKKLNSGSFLVGQMGFFLGHFQFKVLGIFPKCPKMAQNGPKLSKNGPNKLKFAPDMYSY